MRLTSVKESILTLEQEYAQAMQGFAAADLEPFAATADLERATRDVEQAHLESRDAFTRAESTLQSAHSRLGPIVRKIENAEKKDGLKPIAVPEFAVADAEACDTECNRRQQLVEGLEGKIKTLDRACNGLETRLGEIKTKLGEMNALVRRAEDHLPEVWRAELVDYSLPVEELEGALDQLVARLGHAITEIQRLEKAAEDLFEQVRQLIELDTFRRLEPQVADNLRRFSARSAGAERTTLRDRLVERIAVVQEEIDNQLRDQNACLEQLRLHVIHADDLLRRAVRCSRIPDQVPIYGGERLLKVKRRLNDVPPDTVRNQLSIWLDEQVVTGRVPQDGTALAAELLHRVHGGRPLDIEILKPKRDAIQPYMAVDKLGVSGGEGVTVAMMLYTVIQRMAMDERTDGKNAASGGFLMLDNTYGTSNLMEHIVLQKTMADALGIQLFVTTCSEDKHVLNMFPTITRLVQGERVLQGGVPKYIRVRSADYLFKSAGHAA